MLAVATNDILESITVRELLDRFDKEILIPDRNNRGIYKYSIQTVRRVAANPRIQSLGMFSVTETDDPNTKQIKDGHSRIKGLLNARDEGRLNDALLNGVVYLRVVPEEESHQVYEDTNFQSHKAKHKLTNSDYACGHLCDTIYNECKIADNSALFYFGRHQLLYVYHALTSNSSLEIEDVISNRSEARRYMNKMRINHEYKLSMSDKEIFREGIAFYLEVMNLLKEYAKDEKVSKDTRKLTYKLCLSTGMFLYILLDIASPTGYMKHISKATLVARIIDNLATVLYKCNQLPRGARVEMEEFSIQLKQILKR